MTRTPIFDAVLAECAPAWLRDALSTEPEVEQTAGELPAPEGKQAARSPVPN